MILCEKKVYMFYMNNKDNSRTLNGLTNMVSSDMRATRKLMPEGLLIPTKTTATCSANVDATIYVKSSLIEIAPYSGTTATLKYIYVDQKFGATIPDGTILYVTNKGLTRTTFLETGNINCQSTTPDEFVGIAGFAGVSFRSFIYNTTEAEWVLMAKSNDCCIC